MRRPRHGRPLRRRGADVHHESDGLVVGRWQDAVDMVNSLLGRRGTPSLPAPATAVEDLGADLEDVFPSWEEPRVNCIEHDKWCAQWQKRRRVVLRMHLAKHGAWFPEQDGMIRDPGAKEIRRFLREERR